MKGCRMKNNIWRGIQYPVYDSLPEGRENAVKSEVLCTKLGLNSVRDLQKQISVERAHGAIILSCSTGGYFRSSDPTEIWKFIQTTERRGRHTLQSTQSARLYLANLTGQLYLEELLAATGDQESHIKENLDKMEKGRE